MNTVTKTYTILSSIENVFDALTDPKKIEEWSGSESEMNAEEGGTFSLWGGSIHGINRKITSFIRCKHRCIQLIDPDAPLPGFVQLLIFSARSLVKI